MARTTTARKVKRSVTLSVESVKFLNAKRKKRRGASVSSTLEEILQEARRAERRVVIEKSIEDYYNSLTPEEIEENRAWGEFATQQLLSREDIW